MSDIQAIGPWKTNAELIADCHRLGYINDKKRVLDPTYGLGNFWAVYRPSSLVASDLDPTKSPVGYSVDVRSLPWVDGEYGTVVYDAPYSFRGASAKGSADIDQRFGVVGGWTRQDVLDLITEGMTECTRVLERKGHLLVKVQDQVVGGKVRWQTIIAANHGETVGLRLKDMLHIQAYSRPQPPGRSQQHARRNYSTIMVFTKE